MVTFDTLLCKLAYKYGSDKCPQIGHQYTQFYYELFKNKRQKVKKVLEIGVGWGASLFMWRDFFPKATIYGADINKEYLFQTKRIKTYFCDQSKKSHLLNLIKKVGRDIDLFVDDGSHSPNDQVFTCLTLMPALNKKVIYVIEDVADKKIAENLRMYNCEFKRRSKMLCHDDRLLLVRHKV